MSDRGDRTDSSGADDRRPTGHESDDRLEDRDRATDPDHHDRTTDPDHSDRRDETLSDEDETARNEDVSTRNERVSEERERVDKNDERVSAGGDGDGGRGDPSRHADDGGGLSGGLAVLVSALVALVVTALAYWWVNGLAGNEVFFEQLYRVAPTVEGGGVGADWVAGNTVPLLDALIAIVHAADVLMGVMILAMVFLHWAIFRRLGDRMQPPVERRTGDTVATDGGAERADHGDDDARGGDRP